MEICHEWTYDEEFFCCKKYIWFMLKNLPENERADVDLTEYDSFREICKYRTIYDLIIEISNHYKYIPLREIEHKFKQIKQVSNDFHGKDDYVCINPHRYYSEQVKKAFGIAADDVHRELTHQPPPETIEERNARIARDIEKYGKIIISQDDFLDMNWEICCCLAKKKHSSITVNSLLKIANLEFVLLLASKMKSKK